MLWRRSARRTDEGDGGVATKGGEQAGGMVDGVLGHEAHRAGARPGCSGLVRVCVVWPGREEDKVRDLGEEEKVSGPEGCHVIDPCDDQSQPFNTHAIQWYVFVLIFAVRWEKNARQRNLLPCVPTRQRPISLLSICNFFITLLRQE